MEFVKLEGARCEWWNWCWAAFLWAARLWASGHGAPRKGSERSQTTSIDSWATRGRQPTNKWNKEKKPMKGINLMKLNWWMDWRPLLCGMSWLWLGGQPSPRSNFIPIQLIEFPFRTAWLHLASWTIQFHSIHHSTPSKDWLSFIYELVSLILFILLCE